MPRPRKSSIDVKYIKIKPRRKRVRFQYRDYAILKLRHQLAEAMRPVNNLRGRSRPLAKAVYLAPRPQHPEYRAREVRLQRAYRHPDMRPFPQVKKISVIGENSPQR